MDGQACWPRATRWRTWPCPRSRLKVQRRLPQPPPQRKSEEGVWIFHLCIDTTFSGITALTLASVIRKSAVIYSLIYLCILNRRHIPQYILVDIRCHHNILYLSLYKEWYYNDIYYILILYIIRIITTIIITTTTYIVIRIIISCSFYVGVCAYSSSFFIMRAWIFTIIMQ